MSPAHAIYFLQCWFETRACYLLLAMLVWDLHLLSAISLLHTCCSIGCISEPSTKSGICCSLICKWDNYVINGSRRCTNLFCTLLCFVERACLLHWYLLVFKTYLGFLADKRACLLGHRLNQISRFSLLLLLRLCLGYCYYLCKRGCVFFGSVGEHDNSERLWTDLHEIWAQLRCH